MSESATTTHTTPAPAIDSPATAIAPTSAVAGAQASIGQRAGAYLIDIAAVMVFSLVCSFTIGQVAPFLGSLFSLAGIAYILCRDCLPFFDGQSLGKKLLGLRAVTTDSESLSGNWQPGLLRNVILIIPIMALVELIILFTKQDAPEGLLRLGDQWAGTKVITVK